MATNFYTYKPPAPIAIPDVPTGLYNAENRPGLTESNTLLRELEALPSLYSPLRNSAKGSLKDSLTGYGDLFTFQGDDPSTPVDESLNIDYNEKATPGQFYRDAARAVRGRHAARGSLYSSFADKDLGAEAARISAQAKEMVQKYATHMEELGSREWRDRNDVTTRLVSVYGSDSQWLADQVPPPPPPPSVTKVANAGSRPDGLFTWKEWVQNRTKAGIPAKDLTPARFWAYIAKHGGQVK